jgi:ribonuclease HI
MERHDEDALVIYTDGSSKPKPRRGGWAFVVLTENEEGEELLLKYNGAGWLGATNIEMELTACIEALRLVSGQKPPVPKSSYRKIVIYADLLLIVTGAKAAEGSWPERDWRTLENEPVMHVNLWEELVRLKKRAGWVEIRKTKAHSNNRYNELADDLAKEAAELAREKRRPTKKVTRKRTSRQTEARVVPMRGQTETIRIIIIQANPGQPHHKYKYEVVGEGSSNHGDVDEAFAANHINMRRSRTYEVRFAEAERRGRWIEEVVREIERD